MKRKTQRGSWLLGIIVLGLGWFLLYAMRTALSSALKDIGDYWGLSEKFLGFLSSSFFLSYALLQIPAGFLADRYGSRRMIAIGFSVQAAGLLLGVLSKSPIQFLLARVLTGAGQASYFPCQQMIAYHLLPAERRASGIAMTTAGAGLGTAAGFLLGKALSALALGWKMPFLVLGALAIAYVLIVLATLPEPPYGVKKIPAKHAADQAGVKPESTEEGRHRWVFLTFMTITHFLTMYGFFLVLTWLPYYLETVRGLEGGLAAAIPVVMPLIMAPAALLWGSAADKRGSRDFVPLICLPIGGLAIAAIPGMSTPALLAVALAFYGATGKLVLDPVLVATLAEHSPLRNRGTFLAIFNSVASLAMVIAPSVTGMLAQTLGFDISFFIAGGLHVVSLASVILAKRSLGSLVREGGR